MSSTINALSVHALSSEGALKIGAVAGAFILSSVATRLSGVSDPKSKPAKGKCAPKTRATLWQRSVGRSRFEPPSWVFGAVWAFLFTLTPILWLAGDLPSVIPDATDRAGFENLILLAVGLNAGWSLAIIAGSGGVLDARVANWVSLLALIALGVVSVYLACFARRAIPHVDGRYWREIAILYFVVYALWMGAASVLTATAPNCRKQR